LILHGRNLFDINIGKLKIHFTQIQRLTVYIEFIGFFYLLFLPEETSVIEDAF